MHANSSFDPAAFHAALTTTAIGRYLVYRPVTPSTMDLASREAHEGAPHGTIAFAEEQTAGRGRRGRSFHSPAGKNLYVTLVLRCPIEVHRRLPLIVPVAVCAAIQAELPSARIKWPNDIWIGDRKAAGMLIDGELTPAGAVALPGIGINVNADPTAVPELRAIATSLARELGREVAREPLLARICNHLEQLLEATAGHVLQEYRSRSSTLGRRVLVSPVGAPPFEGTAISIEDDGSLVVERLDGTAEVVTAADVSVRPAG
ncbi:MAG: biotin--[acetyl-CoA-carboxylase] ligase [Dehalococcoidia bacterium]|jgi:BirA family biotin operon repressor/biotin-[acetyl-CoA-carboxylase] ligase|nr:biotin--[acetyl-CoA-carboxylase] ligase [Tepidiformaceae bacterium]